MKETAESRKSSVSSVAEQQQVSQLKKTTAQRVSYTLKHVFQIPKIENALFYSEVKNIIYVLEKLSKIFYLYFWTKSNNRIILVNVEDHRLITILG